MFGKVGKAKGSIISARIIPIFEYPFLYSFFYFKRTQLNSENMWSATVPRSMVILPYFLFFLQCIKITMQSVEYSVLVSSIISICINSRYISTWLFGSVQLHVLLTPGISWSLHYTQIQWVVIWDMFNWQPENKVFIQILRIKEDITQ